MEVKQVKLKVGFCLLCEMATKKPAKAGVPTMENIRDLLETLSSDTNRQFSQMNEVLDKQLETMNSRLNSIEDKLNQSQTEIAGIKEENVKLFRKCADLEWKIALIEGQNRRNNIRLVGFPQNMESGNPTEYFSKVLENSLGSSIPQDLNIQRAHRLYLSKDPSKPAPVIIYFQSFKVKDTVFRAARGKMLSFSDKLFRITEDFPQKVMVERVKYRDSMQYFYQEGLRPVLRYPAKLSITMAGNIKKWFANPEEAASFKAEFEAGKG